MPILPSLLGAGWWIPSSDAPTNLISNTLTEENQHPLQCMFKIL